MYVTGNSNTNVTGFASGSQNLFLSVTQSGVVYPERNTETNAFMHIGKPAKSHIPYLCGETHITSGTVVLCCGNSGNKTIPGTCDSAVLCVTLVANLK